MSSELKQILHNLHTIKENIDNNEFRLAEMNISDTIKYVEALVADFKPQSNKPFPHIIKSKDELDYLSPEEVAAQITYFYLKQIESPVQARKDLTKDLEIILYAYKILNDLSFLFNESEIIYEAATRQAEICRKISAICEMHELEFLNDGYVQEKSKQFDKEQDFWMSSGC